MEKKLRNVTAEFKNEGKQLGLRTLSNFLNYWQIGPAEVIIVSIGSKHSETDLVTIIDLLIYTITAAAIPEKVELSGF